MYPSVLSPDGRAVLVCNMSHNGLILVEIATGQKRREIRFDQILPGWQFPPTVRFSPNGSCLLVGDGAAAVAVIDPFTGKLLHRQEGHRSSVGRVAFSPSGRLVACGRGSQPDWPASCLSAR